MLKLTSKFKIGTFLFAFGLIMLLSTAQTSALPWGADDPDNFEDQAYLSGIDMWVNETAPAQAAPGQVASDNGLIKYQIQRYVFLPASVDLSEWTIHDHDAIFILGLWSMPGDTVVTERGDNFIRMASAQTYDERTESGLTSWEEGSRKTDGITMVDANSRVSDNGGNLVDVTFDYLNSTAYTGTIDDMRQNYTIPENEVNSGVAYEASDGKSVQDYAESASEAAGKDWVETLNASMIGYGYDDYDIEAATWNFDDEADSAPGQAAFSLRRVRTFIKSKIKRDKVSNNFFGTKSSSTKNDVNLFKKINNAVSLPGIKPGVTKFYKQKIAPKLQLPKINLGTGALIKTIKRAAPILGGLLLIGGLFAVVVIMRRNQR